MNMKKVMSYAPWLVAALVSGVGLWLIYSKYVESTSPGPVHKQKTDK